eukprot:5063570-Prymnesium_polylepis.1
MTSLGGSCRAREGARAQVGGGSPPDVSGVTRRRRCSLATRAGGREKRAPAHSVERAPLGDERTLQLDQRPARLALGRPEQDGVGRLVRHSGGKRIAVKKCVALHLRKMRQASVRLHSHSSPRHNKSGCGQKATAGSIRVEPSAARARLGTTEASDRDLGRRSPPTWRSSSRLPFPTASGRARSSWWTSMAH